MAVDSRSPGAAPEPFPDPFYDKHPRPVYQILTNARDVSTIPQSAPGARPDVLARVRSLLRGLQELQIAGRSLFTRAQVGEFRNALKASVADLVELGFDPLVWEEIRFTSGLPDPKFEMGDTVLREKLQKAAVRGRSAWAAACTVRYIFSAGKATQPHDPTLLMGCLSFIAHEGQRRMQHESSQRSGSLGGQKKKGYVRRDLITWLRTKVKNNPAILVALSKNTELVTEFNSTRKQQGQPYIEVEGFKDNDDGEEKYHYTEVVISNGKEIKLKRKPISKETVEREIRG